MTLRVSRPLHYPARSGNSRHDPNFLHIEFDDLDQACRASAFAIVPANLASPERTTVAISSLARMPGASSRVPRSGTSIQASEATRADIVVSVSMSDA